VEQEVVRRWVMSRGGGPAGRICSTVGDLLTFARMHTGDGRAADGTQVLSPASVKAMREPQVDIPDRHSLGDAWGLGWILYNWSGQPLFGHDGATVGQNARLKILLDRNIALALVCNGGNSLALYRALFTEVFREIAGVDMPPSLQLPDTPPALDLAAYEGSYERLNVRMDLAAADGRLVGTLSYAGSLLEIVPKPVIDIEAKPVDASSFLYSTPEVPDASPMAFYAFDAAGRPGFMHAGGRAMRHT
jgi:hypothetical protein